MKFCYLHLSLNEEFFVFLVLCYFHFLHPIKSNHNLLKIEIWQKYIFLIIQKLTASFKDLIM
jgi:hypothetical protein